jgi:plastocyanin
MEAVKTEMRSALGAGVRARAAQADQPGSQAGEQAGVGGEVYVFTPSLFAVHRDEPTAITFWNLQPDDDHDFMLADPDLNVRMKVTLRALQRTPYLFTFHREGLFEFYCTMHQPAMSGQVLVLPPAVP